MGHTRAKPGAWVYCRSMQRTETVDPRFFCLRGLLYYPSWHLCFNMLTIEERKMMSGERSFAIGAPQALVYIPPRTRLPVEVRDHSRKLLAEELEFALFDALIVCFVPNETAAQRLCSKPIFFVHHRVPNADSHFHRKKYAIYARVMAEESQPPRHTIHALRKVLRQSQPNPLIKHNISRLTLQTPPIPLPQLLGPKVRHPIIIELPPHAPRPIQRRRYIVPARHRAPNVPHHRIRIVPVRRPHRLRHILHLLVPIPLPHEVLALQLRRRSIY